MTYHGMTLKGLLSISYKSLPFLDDQEKTFSPVTANFFATKLILVFLSYPEVPGNRPKSKRNYMAADSHTNNFQGLTNFLNSFFNDFFSKDSALSSALGNPIDSFHSLGVALKNRPKLKNIVRKYKKQHQNWKKHEFELQPRFFHQHLALNKGLLKNCC